MGDDGVGPAAAARLQSGRLPGSVRVHDAGLAVCDVLGTLDPADPLIVIDAVRAGGRPGAVYELRVDPEADDVARGQALSLHELSVLPALRLEALTGRVFRDVTVLGIEPGHVGWKMGLSPDVEEALGRVVEAALVRARQASRSRRRLAPANGRGAVAHPSRERSERRRGRNAPARIRR
jgi:hydrogenase maturation protease